MDLCKINEKRPWYEKKSLDITQAKKNLKNLLELELDRVFRFEDKIHDIKRVNLPKSKIAESKDFAIIQKWLPEGYKFNLDLLFQGSRDGRAPDVFHKLCDNKDPTLTLIKAKARKTRDIHIVGGFLDKDWHQNQKVPICSDRAFLFSVTSDLKCPVINAEKPAFGKWGYGPVFGEGPDLGVVDFNFNHSIPSSYQDSAKIFGLLKRRWDDDDDDEDDEAKKKNGGGRYCGLVKKSLMCWR